MAFGREVAEAYIEVHGDLSPFRRDLARAQILTQNFGRKLQGLAGLNVLEDTFRFGIRFMQNIDRNAVKIANMATLVGTVTAGITQFVGATAALSTDLVALGQIGILAPGFLTGFGIALGVSYAALKDMSVVLKDLGPAFQRLQNSISARFWEQAEQPIRNLVDSLMPTLNTQLTNTAEAMGSLFGELATSFKNEATPERVTVMFERLNKALTIAKAGIGPFVRAMVNLGEVGSKQFERFAHWVVELSEQFDAFVTKSIDNGNMDRWIEEAIEGFKNVGRAIDGAIGIVNALDSAFRAAGGGGLALFASNLQAAAAVMQGETFQTALTQAFVGARAAMDGLFTGIGLLGEAFVDLGPTFMAVGGQIGQILTILGAHLRDFLMNDELQRGFITFMSDAQVAIRNLGPAIEPLAQSMGSLLDLMGEVLKSVSEVATTLLVQWGPILDQMSGKLSELVTPLKTALESVITTLTPALQSFSDNVLGPVVDIIKNDVLPAIEGIAKAVGPSLTVVFEELGAFLRDDLAPIFRNLREDYQAAGEDGDELAVNLRNVMQAVEDFLNIASSPRAIFEWLNSEPVKQFDRDVNNNLGSFWENLRQNFFNGNRGLSEDITSGWESFRQSAQQGVASFDDSVNQGLEDFWGGVGTTITNGWNGFWADFTTGWNTGMAEFQNFITTAPADIWNGFVQGLQSAAAGIAASVIAPFTDWVNQIRTFFGIHSPSTLFMGFGADIVQGFINGVLSLIGGITTVATQMVQAFMTGFTGLGEFIGQALANVGTFASQAWNNILATVNGFFASFNAGWNGFWSTIGNIVSVVWNAVVTFVQGGISRIQGFITSGMAVIGNLWNSVWSNVSSFAGSVWNTISSLVSSGIQRVQSFVQSGLSTINSIWNSIWSSVSSFASSAWNQITSFVSSGMSRVSSLVSAGMNSIRSFFSSAWSAVTSLVSSAWAGITGAISGGVNSAVSLVSSMVSRIVGSIGSLAGQMVSAGRNAIQGFINGMSGMIGSVVNAAANIAGQAMAAVRKALNLGSPSKVMRQYGEWTGEGFAIGMDNMEGLVHRTAGAMAEAALSVFSDKSMYQTGADAAIALSNGLKDNTSALDNIVADMTPAMTAKFEAMGSLTPTASLSGPGVGGSKTVVFEEGAFQLVTPTKDPELVVYQVMDEFANNSNF
jgi:phage-related protein